MEAVAIVSATVGAISLLINARVGLERLALDIDHFKTGQELELHSLIAEISITISAFHLWKSLWRVNETAPTNFHEDVWGFEGCRIISDLVITIRNHANKTRREIKRAYGIKSKENDEPGYEVYISSSHRRRDSDKGGLNFFRKVVNTLFQSRLIEEHIKKLNQDVDRLDQLSKFKLLQTHGTHIPADKKPELEKWIDDRFKESFLFALEDESRAYSEALYQECLAHAQDIASSELGLEKLVRIPSRDDPGLRHDDSEPAVVYDIIANLRQTRSNNVAVRFIILAMKRQAIRCPCNPVLSSGLLATHEAGDCECDRRCRGYFRLPTHNEPMNHKSDDTKYFHNTSSYQVEGGCDSLRLTLCQKSNEFMTRLHGDFSKRERLALAYKLALFTFIMLQTSWISEICSCMIVRRDSIQQREYRVRIGREIHHSDTIIESHLSCCQKWCAESFRNMPIRRLGLLLTEIAIAQTICNAELNEDMNTMEIRLHPSQGDSSDSRPYFVGDIMPKIAVEASHDFADVVGWCLAQRLEPINLHREAVGEFYHNVLKP